MIFTNFSLVVISVKKPMYANYKIDILHREFILVTMCIRSYAFTRSVCTYREDGEDVILVVCVLEKASRFYMMMVLVLVLTQHSSI